MMLANNKRPDEEIKLEVVSWNEEEHMQDSVTQFDELKEGMTDLGITLSYRLESHHDRFIAADNGWKMVLGRGLDIFEKVDGRFSPGVVDQTKRKCKTCEITFLSI
jgi:ATP-dependent Lon protease